MAVRLCPVLTAYGTVRDEWANAHPCPTTETGDVITSADAMSVAWTTTMADVMESVTVAATTVADAGK